MKLLEESFGATKAAEKAKLEWNAPEKGNSFLTGFLTSNFSLCVEQPMILSKVRLIATLLKNLHWLPISVSLRAKVLAKAYRVGQSLPLHLSAYTLLLSHWFTPLQLHLLFLKVAKHQLLEPLTGRLFQTTRKLALSLPSGLCSNVTSFERVP